MGVFIPAYKWAKEIKRLDGGRCAFCGSTENLESHHIKAKAEKPELATDLENGITLCHKCHYTAHGGDYTTHHYKCFSDRGFACSPKEMQAFIAEYAESKAVIEMPKEYLDALKAHAESTGESVNAFIKRAIMEVTEMDNMHRAYQRGLLRHLEKMNDALERNDQEETKKLLQELIEDTKADIAD